MNRRTSAAVALGFCAALLTGCGEESATDDPGAEPSGGASAVAQTYALPGAGWCDQLDLTATADTLGVPLTPVTDYPAAPEVSGDLGLQCVYGGGTRPAAGTSGSDPASSLPPALTVVVDLVLSPAGTAPDLDEARAFYATKGEDALEVSTSDVTGWWGEGTQGSADLATPGSDVATGYRCGTTVVDDNLTVDVSISADPTPDGVEPTTIDAARDELLDAVHDGLTVA